MKLQTGIKHVLFTDFQNLHSIAVSLLEIDIIKMPTLKKECAANVLLLTNFEVHKTKYGTRIFFSDQKQDNEFFHNLETGTFSSSEGSKSLSKH